MVSALGSHRVDLTTPAAQAEEKMKCAIPFAGGFKLQKTVKIGPRSWASL